MTKIGLLSDTHSHWDDKYVKYFSVCDEIWHAGDIGNDEILLDLEKIKPVRAVYGNIDNYILRKQLSKVLRFKVEDVEVVLTHIGGYPGKYASEIRSVLYHNPPNLFVCGHSHILKVIYDESLNMLCVNPGAAGKYGFHKQRTLMRFDIDGKEIKNMEIIELAD